MSVRADVWYSSGTFWGVVGVAATVLLGALGVWAAFRAAKPRQELAYELVASVSLIERDEGLPDGEGVEIRVDGKSVRQARVVELRITNRGRRDIATSKFDQARPLRIEVGAPVRTILKVESTPAEYRTPRVEIDEQALLIGPDLIKKGQRVSVSLMADGPRSSLTAPEPPFIDVDLRDRSGVSFFRMPVSTYVGSLAAAVILTLSQSAISSNLVKAEVMAGALAAIMITTYILVTGYRKRR